MELNEKDIRKLSVLFIILILAVLVFILLEPIMLSIIGGMILAYAFFPIYKLFSRKIKSKNLAASMVSLFVILIIIIPSYFLIPLLINQIFNLFQQAQQLDMQTILQTFFPSAPESFIIHTSVTLNSLISKVTSTILNTLLDILLDIPKILFHLAIVAFVFFFALRDSEKLGEYVSALSPLNKIQEKKLVQQFKNITNSVIYGQIVIGIAQGVVAGIGLFIFGVPHALLLSLIAVLLSVIPILGPFFVWIPATIYLALQGNTAVTVAFLVYNLLIVSNIDNLLRIYLISKKADLSQVIVLIGMVGGLFIFSILGLIIGPLLLAYFLVLLQAYKENSLSSMFRPDAPQNAT